MHIEVYIVSVLHLTGKLGSYLYSKAANSLKGWNQKQKINDFFFKNIYIYIYINFSQEAILRRFWTLILQLVLLEYNAYITSAFLTSLQIVLD